MKKCGCFRKLDWLLILIQLLSSVAYADTSTQTIIFSAVEYMGGYTCSLPEWSRWYKLSGNGSSIWNVDIHDYWKACSGEAGVFGRNLGRGVGLSGAEQRGRDAGGRGGGCCRRQYLRQPSGGNRRGLARRHGIAAEGRFILYCRKVRKDETPESVLSQLDGAGLREWCHRKYPCSYSAEITWAANRIRPCRMFFSRLFSITAEFLSSIHSQMNSIHPAYQKFLTICLKNRRNTDTEEIIIYNAYVLDKGRKAPMPFQDGRWTICSATLESCRSLCPQNIAQEEMAQPDIYRVNSAYICDYYENGALQIACVVI